MIAATELRLVLVTPETTLVDTPVKSVVLPLYDGQMGVLPGRAPVVGRLGSGELRFESGGGSKRYFIDGGFVQIKGSIISILTHMAKPVDAIDTAAAEQALVAANALKPTTDFEFAEKQRAQDRARRMRSLGRRF
jgi:F-type H+-transporting ATPase subunit epsilon